ncbi:MAG: thrombospondin type 3 repeat-containing protein [Candidatus Yonathbacteria bacterium]|nr:thrombospondin type 3 repeat-containing protein [Candidatus Yonathbacteria bacterium]
MKKFLLFLLLITGNISFARAASEPIKNAGFIPANIWYSKDPFFAEEKIRIYTIIFNGSAYDLEGTVEFLDNGALVGKTPFSLAGGGRVRDVWIDWKAVSGKHIMTAQITHTTASLAGATKHAIVLDNTETGKSERIVDMDTDGDGIGNTEDLDDDNDGVPDITELQNGTDPLKKDTDGNGISDGKELEIAIQQKEKTEGGFASSTEAREGFAGTIQKVEDYIPSPVKAGAMVSANAIERFRIGEGYQFRLAKENKMREIDAMKSPVTLAQKDRTALAVASHAAEKPLAYAMLAALGLLQYVFEWQIIFYGLFLYSLYRVAKWVVVKIRNK